MVLYLVVFVIEIRAFECAVKIRKLFIQSLSLPMILLVNNSLNYLTCELIVQ